ncbi:MAG: PKD domain-containing protein [Candidatus Bathyarchaeota archaeon]|nr:PKD domain-containing protein [Candidatus Bathyarchaeota archaeon]
MKKQLKLLVILLTLVFSMFNLASITLFHPVNATYVEGPITQDTFWTLVNSPFVLSNNVTIYPNATLTIESGVEVKFGESFCLIVNGRILANGLTDKMIRFTSNKLVPEKGDWNTILINSIQQCSLINCIIEYGTNGITVEDGSLIMLNSFTRLNSQNGIVIDNGVVIAENNEIDNNAMSGIYLTGGAQITIKSNGIKSNGDGISLTGILIGEIHIEQNIISLNDQSGIVLAADAYDNTVIINNDISANLNGFRVSTDTSTHITRNYISNNMVGIYYEIGNSHEAHFNDVCDNSMGVDVSSTATVDATYNYWGHRSGPLHELLNPYGKGNPVGGDGVNLDFIFFLSAPIDNSNTLPTASLWTDKVLVAPNQTVTFIGADSYDDGRVDQYFYDFGDGTSSDWTTLSLYNHTYTSTGTYIASLTVIDDFNVTSTNIATATISVQDLTPLSVLITLSDYTANHNTEVSVTVYVSNETGALGNANVTLFSVKSGEFNPISGLTDSIGYFAATFTTPNVTEITNLRIIARASGTGYADGSDYQYLEVIPPLQVQISTEPTKVKSEEEATVTVLVTGGFEEPITNASLELSVDYGVLSSTNGFTDSNGKAEFEFTAPQTSSQIDVTILASATKAGYSEGYGQAVLIVEQKTLVLEVIAEPAEIVSEATSNITVQVLYDTNSIQEANVTITSETLLTATALTDFEGYATFIFTAPQVVASVNITVVVYASKTGYADGEYTLNITVNPGILNVEVQANPSEVMSRESAVVTVNVRCNTNPVANVSLMISASQGDLPVSTGFTDLNGQCMFVYNAPGTTQQLPPIVITVNASKNGYISGGNQTTISVTPEASNPWSLTTILLILIPVVIVVIVVVLIKLKVISFSAGEEE